MMKIIKDFFVSKYKRFEDYIYDSSIDVNDRSFIVFSAVVLIALFAAVPCGIIMHEPLLATISTFIGAVGFTLYVVSAFKRGQMRRAKIVISIILVFVFLPVMFFTNGGVYGGAPVWLLLGTIYIALILEGRFKRIMLLVNMITMIIYWTIGYMFPDLITSYSRSGNYFDTMAAIVIVSWIIFSLISFQSSLSRREEADRKVRTLFEQTANALVSAIDAKDKYTEGHSSRVAKYSRAIAEKAGKSQRECDDIFFTALLHDVGKIGVPEAIIKKEGKLTPEEYEEIKKHPEKGEQILKSITEIPFISIGALHHHERYDGKGYPGKLIGTDIPEYARIISVADAYDAMTSIRSYREIIPQQQVREEFVKGIGTQFDPEFARIMIHLIDKDTEYQMKERAEGKQDSGKNELTVGSYRSLVSNGIPLTPFTTSISLRISADKNIPGRVPEPSIILFDSLDGRFHSEENEIEELLYFEYGEIKFDGQTTVSGARRMVTETTDKDPDSTYGDGEYRIVAERINDHVRISISSKDKTHTVTIALPDSARYSYIGFSGRHCSYHNIVTTVSDTAITADDIPRIAEEISYINVPAGDIPNIQVDGYRRCATDGIKVTDGMKITFHTFSLPTARLVWHCPYINVFTSEDGKPYGKGYKDYMLMRLDGECWEGDPGCHAILSVNRNDDFDGWDAWKAFNKNGYDVTLTFERRGNDVTIRTENYGIVLKNTASVIDDPREIYVSLTGDQCAITNIRNFQP